MSYLKSLSALSVSLMAFGVHAQELKPSLSLQLKIDNTVIEIPSEARIEKIDSKEFLVLKHDFRIPLKFEERGEPGEKVKVWVMNNTLYGTQSIDDVLAIEKAKPTLDYLDDVEMSFDRNFYVVVRKIPNMVTAVRSRLARTEVNCAPSQNGLIEGCDVSLFGSDAIALAKLVKNNFNDEANKDFNITCGYSKGRTQCVVRIRFNEGIIPLDKNRIQWSSGHAVADKLASLLGESFSTQDGLFQINCDQSDAHDPLSCGEFVFKSTID